MHVRLVSHSSRPLHYLLVCVCSALVIFMAVVMDGSFAAALVGFLVMHAQLLAANCTTIEMYEKDRMHPWPYNKWVALVVPICTCAHHCRTCIIRHVEVLFKSFVSGIPRSGQQVLWSSPRAGKQNRAKLQHLRNEGGILGHPLLGRSTPNRRPLVLHY